jgi:predicted transcriptional regulator
MSIKIKSGSLSDFFDSAKETAKEIDEGKLVTRKNTIWVDSKELMYLLKPERADLIRYLRGKKRVCFSDLASKMKRTAVSLNKDLILLSKYQLVKMYKETNPGHGVHKVVEPMFGSQKIEFRAEI